MRFFLAVSFAVLAITLRLTGTETPSLAGQRVLVLGDSITQDGRYVSFLKYYLHTAAQPADLVSIGLSSETVSGLSELDHPFPRPHVIERLDRALTVVNPQVVLACYGMNDGIYHPPSTERLAAFKAGLRQLIEKVKAAGASLVLITPPVFDALPLAAKVVPATAPQFGYGAPYAGYDDVLAEFAAAEVALDEPGVTVIDLHTAMARAVAAARQHDPGFTFSRDGVHPGDAGHLLMAQTIARGLGLAVPSTGLDVELARLSADPTFTLIGERRALRSEAWLPYIGYTRGAAVKSESVKAAEVVAVRLQQLLDAAAAR